MADRDSPAPVAAALIDTIGLLTRRLRQVRPTPDLSHPEAIAISSLERHGPSTTAELARHESIRAQSMHATVTGLVERGLVERTADPADGRRLLVSITAEGKAVADAKRAARAEQLLRALTDDFSPEERATLLAAAPLLERLGRSL
jgi:DNA-binding MarR family transcriptional regulator